MNQYKTQNLTVDIAEYNSYIIEIKARNMDDANKIIFSMSKQIMKDVQYKRIAHAVKKIYQGASSFMDTEFLNCKFLDVEKNIYKIFPIEKIKEKIDKKEKLMFCYKSNIAEYNRYVIEINSESKEIARNRILTNGSREEYGYKPTLIQISAREYFENYQKIMFLE
jgi:hypothetical protein